jgi:hypothetical protein
MTHFEIDMRNLLLADLDENEIEELLLALRIVYKHKLIKKVV